VPCLLEILDLLRVLDFARGRHFVGADYNNASGGHGDADGRGVASHAGSRLLADLAEVTGLRREFSGALAPLRQRRGGHDPGRVLVDLAVMLADGGEAISDLAVLRDQPGLFGPVASTATAWRVLDAVDDRALAGLGQARAVARDRFWAQRDDLGRGVPAAMAAGRELPGLVLDLDASLINVHSDKQSAAATFKGGFGYHPLLCWLDNTGEALAGRLRPGNAGANTATDHIAVLDDALAQTPDAHRHGTRSGPMGRAVPKTSWPTSGRCATGASRPSSRSGSR
jgi:hypothetical protein